jgi:hypothetical protein
MISLALGRKTLTCMIKMGTKKIETTDGDFSEDKTICMNYGRWKYSKKVQRLANGSLTV